MSTIELSFTCCTEDRSRIPNDTMRTIRRYIAQTLENCGFGPVQEDGEDKFHNLYATPTTDEFYDLEGDLFISYIWWYPIPEGHGRYDQLVTVGLPQIKSHLRTNHNIYVIIRLCFT